MTATVAASAGRWSTLRRWLVNHHPRAVPATFLSAALLLAVWLLLRIASKHYDIEFVERASTDMKHLSSQPVAVLVASAFTLPSVGEVAEVLLSVLILAPVERLIGRWRMIAVFLFGHVAATYLSEVGSLLMHLWHHAVPFMWTRPDVGPSYGLLAVLAVLCLRIPNRRVRTVMVVAAISALTLVLALLQDLTSVGHVLAFTLGLLVAPRVLRHTSRATVHPAAA